jgi:hypothetical protein
VVCDEGLSTGTATQREKDEEELAELHLRGLVLRELGRELGRLLDREHCTATEDCAKLQRRPEAANCLLRELKRLRNMRLVPIRHRLRLN